MKLLLIKWRYNILHKYIGIEIVVAGLAEGNKFTFLCKRIERMMEHFAIDKTVIFSRRLEGVTPEGWIHLYVCVCACALCVHGRILSWSQVFRITRGRNPWNTLDDVDVRRKLPSPIEGSRQRDRRRTRRRGSRPVIGRCSCKISILIRKTATAARIVGWNRRRNRAALPGRRRRSFEPPRALCIPDGRVSAFRTQWSETNCRHYDATVVNPVREHEASVRRIHAQFTHIHCYRAGNRVCVCISIFPMKNFFLAVFLNFLCTYYT